MGAGQLSRGAKGPGELLKQQKQNTLGCPLCFKSTVKSTLDSHNGMQVTGKFSQTGIAPPSAASERGAWGAAHWQPRREGGSV